MRSSPPACPSCGAQGRPVQPITPRSLLREAALARLDPEEAIFFCRSATCEVVYFSAGGTRFDTGEVRVTVFQKSEDPERLVCYCFEHSVAAIEAEVRRSGTSTVPDTIAEKCRQGLDRCEEKNPQGTCCLGNVRAVIQAAAARAGAPAPKEAEGEPLPACCSPGGACSVD
jgi:hypothetical protein